MACRRRLRDAEGAQQADCDPDLRAERPEPFGRGDGERGDERAAEGREKNVGDDLCAPALLG